MSATPTDAEVIDFPKPAAKKPSSTERIWGKAVYDPLHPDSGAAPPRHQCDADEHHHPAPGLLA